MAAHHKKAHQLARELFKLSFADGAVSPERVAGVLAYVEKARPANPMILLKAYQRLIATELAKGQAVVEHAGTIDNQVLQQVADSLTRRYGRRVTASAKRNDSLLAGIRVRVADDIYESSVAGQLAALSASV